MISSRCKFIGQNNSSNNSRSNENKLRVAHPCRESPGLGHGGTRVGLFMWWCWRIDTSGKERELHRASVEWHFLQWEQCMDKVPETKCECAGLASLWQTASCRQLELSWLTVFDGLVSDWSYVFGKNTLWQRHEAGKLHLISQEKQGVGEQGTRDSMTYPVVYSPYPRPPP